MLTVLDAIAIIVKVHKEKLYFGGVFIKSSLVA